MLSAALCALVVVQLAFLDEAFSAELKTESSENAAIVKNPPQEKEGETLSYNKRLFYFSINKPGGKNRLNWYDAQAQCRNMGGFLASVRNEKENLFIKTHIGRFPSRPFWIGLFNPQPSTSGKSVSSVFKWLDGSELKFGTKGKVYPWEKTCPAMTGETCVYISTYGLWKTVSAYPDCRLFELPFICNVPRHPAALSSSTTCNCNILLLLAMLLLLAISSS